MQPLFQGILLGLTITISIGPGFFALFQTSISQGVKAGFAIAFGILISDLVLISISYCGLSKVIVQGNNLLIGSIAALILITMGILTVSRKSSVNFRDTGDLQDYYSKPFHLIAKGFLLNIANPFVLIFWLGIMGFAASKYGMHSYSFFIFFIGLLITGFSSDLMKCRLSGFFKKVLTPRSVTIVNQILGLVFIVLGILVFIKSYVAFQGF